MSRHIRIEDTPAPAAQPIRPVPKLTREQAAIIGAFTGITCGPFMDVHAYAERVLGTPIGSSAFGMVMVAERLKEAARADFIALCADLDQDIDEGSVLG